MQTFREWNTGTIELAISVFFDCPANKTREVREIERESERENEIENERVNERSRVC